MDPSKQPGIKFTGVDLVELQFAVRGQPPSQIPVEISFGMDARISEDETTLDLFMKTDLFGGLAEERRPPIDFTFVLHGRFVTSGETNLPLREFAQDHAPAHLMPYARELVASITTRSVLPTLNLGPINIIALVRQGKASLQVEQAKKGAQEA